MTFLVKNLLFQLERFVFISWLITPGYPQGISAGITAEIPARIPDGIPADESAIEVSDQYLGIGVPRRV